MQEIFKLLIVGVLDIFNISTFIIALISLVLLIIYFKRNKKNVNSEESVNFLLLKLQNQFDILNSLITQSNTMYLNVNQNASERLENHLTRVTTMQNSQLVNIENRIKELLQATENRLNHIDIGLKDSLNKMLADNSVKLDKMRETVDEKLNSSLERRFNESFKQIADRLDNVHRGLGEMQELATGVGDLKKVLTNVKTRGVWGEVQLGQLLEQMLAPNQFSKEVQIKEGLLERVDYVINLPGTHDEITFLPIDAKFPLEDYSRLLDANDKGNSAEIDRVRKALHKRVLEEAKTIRQKYIEAPKTTDFAIMYLPIEGLFAEIVKDTNLLEKLQQEYRVSICGPTTLTSIINCIQMGFKSVAIEKHSSEVWELLTTFKTEFVKFVDLLSKTQKKLDEASNTIEDATKKSKTIQRKLNKVDLLDDKATLKVIKVDEVVDEEDDKG
ncbi:MAG: DNA recombination protein RmuC [Bacilli bacterium]